MKSFPFLREWEEIVYVSCWKPTTFCYFTVKREIKEIGSETFTCPAFTWITGCVKRHQKFLTGPTIIFASISSSTRGNCRCLNVHYIRCWPDEIGGQTQTFGIPVHCLCNAIVVPMDDISPEVPHFCLFLFFPQVLDFFLSILSFTNVPFFVGKK